MDVLFLFAPENLTMMLNLLLLGVALIVIVYALFSMLKKALPQAFHFVFFILVMLVGVFLVKPGINALASYDLSSYGIVLNINESQIQVTNVLDTISEVIKLFAGNDKESIIYIALNDKDLNEFIQSMAMLIVGYVTFFAYMLIALLLSKPIGSFIYNVIFKWIFPKKVRKYKYKRRWKSFLIGLTKGTIAAFMLLTPFTSLINSINKGIQQNKSSVIVDQESYDEIITWVDAYNDSVLAKVAFGVDDEGRSLDMVITDIATSSTYDGEQLLFSDQLTTLADAAEKLIAAGLLNNEGEEGGIQTSALLSKEVITALIGTLTGSDFLMKLFPILINIALTYAQETEFFLNEVNLDDVDWKDELNTINKIYNSLYDAGIITDLTDGGDFAIPFTDESRTIIHDAFNTFDESKLFSRVLPAVIYSFVNQEDEEGNPSELSLYLSTEWEDYESIRWGHELCIVYDTLFQLDKIDIKLNINMGGNSDESTIPEVQEFKFVNGFFKNPLKEEQSEENNDQESEDIFKQLMEKFDDIIVILTGLDKDGNKVETHEFETLFDSDLLMNSIDKLLPTLVDSLFSEEGGEGEGATSLIDKDEFIGALETLEDKDDYKFETYSLLKISKDLLFSEEFDLLGGSEENILDNDAFKDALIEVSPAIDRSKILSTCLPTVFESLLGEMSFGEGIPLSGKDLNFRNIKFAEEIPVLLEGYDSIMSIASSLDSSSIDGVVKNINTDDLSTALKAIYKSKILNPVKDGEANSNFYAVLDMIFNNEDFASIGLYADKDPNYAAVSNWNTEIDAIANVFTKMKGESILGMLNQSSEFSLSSVEGQEISELFAAIDDSYLLKGTFGDVMDNLVLDLLNMDLNGITFNNVVSWEDEGVAFASAIESFKKFGKEFSEIDWVNSDPAISEELLTTFASLQLFTDQDGEYHFDEYVHDMLVTSGALTSYLKDYPMSGEATYEMSKADFASADWSVEVSKIIDVIEALQERGKASNPGTLTPGTDGINLISGGNAKSSDLDPIVNALCDASSFRMVTFNVINETLKGTNSPLALEGVNLNVANTEYLLTDDNELRKSELNKIIHLYELIETNQSGDESLNEAFDIYQLDIDDLLTTIHDSHILNSLTENNNDTSTFTVFEQIIEYMLSQKGLTSYITNSTTTVKDLVSSIQNDRLENDNIDEWTEEEIPALAKIVKSSEALNGSFSDTALIDLDKEEFISLMQSINHSKLTHNSIPHFFEESSTRMGLINFIEEEHRPYVHYDLEQITDYDEKVIQYDDEIVHMAEVIDTAKIGVDSNGDAILFDFNDDAKSAETLVTEYGKTTTPFFALLIDSRIYEDVREEIIYGVVEDAGMENFIRGTGREGKLAQLKEFFNNEEYNLNSDVEGKSFDLILQDMDNIQSFGATELKDFVDNHPGEFDDHGSDMISDIIRDTVVEITIEDGNEESRRAYFASEIVAGIMAKSTAEDSHGLEWVVDGGTSSIDTYPLLVDDVADQIHDLLVAYDDSNKLDATDDASCNKFKADMIKLDEDELTKTPYILNNFKEGVFGDYAGLAGVAQNMTFAEIADAIIAIRQFEAGLI